MARTITSPTVLTDPGVLWVAPLGTADPTNTVAGGVFTDDPAAAWIPLGPTTEGTTFSYSTTVEPIRFAEFFDPVKYATTERNGSIAFNLGNYTLSNYRRALNGGIAALVAASGTGATSLFTLTPPTPGSETRSMILWESTDQTLRILIRQALQGGEITSAFNTAPDVAVIPCTFNMEIPAGGGQPWQMWGTQNRG